MQREKYQRQWLTTAILMAIFIMSLNLLLSISMGYVGEVIFALTLAIGAIMAKRLFSVNKQEAANAIMVMCIWSIMFNSLLAIVLIPIPLADDMLFTGAMLYILAILYSEYKWL